MKTYNTARPRNGRISASVMCADMMNLGADIKELERLGIEYLHIDVMDGCFVPNYALGADIIKILRRSSPIKLDIHLMITEPERKLGCFDIREGDIVSFHCEATAHCERTAALIRELGATPFPALNPATPLCALEYLADEVGGALLMTVNPGYAGQKLIPRTIGKIAELRRLYPELIIETDGNVSAENAALMREAGADIFVAGSSGLFIKGASLEESAARLRRAIR